LKKGKENERVIKYTLGPLCKGAGLIENCSRRSFWAFIFCLEKEERCYKMEKNQTKININKDQNFWRPEFEFLICPWRKKRYWQAWIAERQWLGQRSRLLACFSIAVRPQIVPVELTNECVINSVNQKNKKTKKTERNKKGKELPIFSFKPLMSCLTMKVSSWISTGRSSKIDFFFTTTNNPRGGRRTKEVDPVCGQSHQNEGSLRRGNKVKGYIWWVSRAWRLSTEYLFPPKLPFWWNQRH
jgi:hypothetical protein